MKKTPPRKERRQLERDFRKGLRERLRLVLLEDGGSPERPIVVSSASLVEVTAKSTPCFACGAEVRIAAHDAILAPSGPQRKVSVRCTMCAANREVYYRIVSVAN